MQADADMNAMMYKTAALLPEDLVAAGQQPLLLLDACIEEGRPLAVVRAGAARVGAPALATAVSVAADCWVIQTAWKDYCLSKLQMPTLTNFLSLEICSTLTVCTWCSWQSRFAVQTIFSIQTEPMFFKLF